MVKYHINQKTGRVNKCYATKRACPIGGKHYPSKEEAYNDTTLNQKIIPQTLQKSKISQKSIDFLKFTIKNIPEKPTTLDLIQAGNNFNKILFQELSFDPNTIQQKDLTKEQLLELKNKTIEVFNTFTSFNNNFNDVFEGPLAKNVNEVSSVLPDGAKKLFRRKVQVVKTRRGAFRSGQYAFNGMKNLDPAVRLTKDFSSFKLEQISNDSFVTNEFHTFKKINDNYDLHINVGERVNRLSSDGSQVEEYWIGVSPRVTNTETFKKVKGSFTISDGRSNSLIVDRPDLNVYKIYRKSIGGGDRMEIPSYIYDDNDRSVILHELSHGLQYNSGLDREKSAFKEFSMGKNKKYSSSFECESIEGFPTDYMGKSDGSELFTVATEGVFFPNANNNYYLYGSDRVENADKIKDWTVGHWLYLDKIGRERSS